MEMESEKLSTWIARQLGEKSWSARELARRMGVSHTNVNNVINGRARPSADFCLSLAKVLGTDPEQVLRLAGRLPPIPPKVVYEGELLKIFRTLPPDRRAALLDAARGMAGHRQPLPYPAPRGTPAFALDPVLVARGEQRPMDDEQLTAIKLYFERIWETAPSQLKGWVADRIAEAQEYLAGREQEEVELPCGEERME